MWLSMPEAGPSRPYKRDEKIRIARWERQYAEEKREVDRLIHTAVWVKRQDQSEEGRSSTANPSSASTQSGSALPSAALASGASASENPPGGPAASTSPTSTPSTATTNLPTSSSSSFPASLSAATTAQSTGQVDTATSPTKSISFYTYTRTQPAPSPSFVPGQTFDLQLAGELADEAVYAVKVTVGHGAGVTRRRSEGRHRSEAKMAEGKRQQGPPILQTLMLQVDLGSSDMWLATTGCMSADCRAAKLFNPTGSIDSGVSANLTYHSGSVSGEIMWEAITMSTFSIAYQAFVASSDVVNQNLDGGEYSGILGLALPANSIISSEIPGTTSSDPDGAIFLDNLFGSGIYAPTQRIFSLALERRNDVRTRSFLTLGSVDDKYCPSPCEPKYLPIIAQPSLGTTGYLHWRIALQGIRATQWSDQAQGQGASVTNIQLGPSIAVPSRNQPLAVLDSGGVAIFVGNLAYANAIYAPWGVTAGSDGLYRIPCKTQIALSFNFGGEWFDVHPLDLSWPDPSDPSQQTCIGAVQYTNQLGSRGDFVLGSAFLKNVYSIYSYPDPTARGTWQPAVGLYPLTNASVASTDFYAVRYMRQPLSSVSADGPDMTSGSSASPSTGQSGSEGGGRVMNTTAIVAGSVVGFFAIAAALFCGWWFWLRHKYGGDGKVVYREAPERKSVASTEDASSTKRRHRKHESAQRQRSMIDGYKDGYDDEGSWTEHGDSFRMTHLGDLVEEDEGGGSPGLPQGHTRSPSLGGVSQLVEHSTPTMKLVDLVEPPLLTEGGITLPLTPVQLARQHSAVPSYVSGLGLGEDGPATPGSTRPLLVSSPGLSTPGIPDHPPASVLPIRAERQARRTSISPQREFGLSLSNHMPRSASLSMAGPFPSPMPPASTPGSIGAPGGSVSGNGSRRGPSGTESTQPRPPVRGSLRHLDSSPMYDIQTTDYFDVKPADSAWNRRGRSGDRGGGT